MMVIQLDREGLASPAQKASLDVPSVTVCTPTYNRSYLLHRVFASLLAQGEDAADIEWIVVDDGSADDTGGVVAGFANASSFPVRYIRQDNRGKHVAVNKGLKEARGELFLILDSDDACAPGTLALIRQEWSTVRNLDHVAGMTFLTADLDNRIVGTRFPHDRHIDTLPVYYDRYKVAGDKCDVHRTEVLRQFPFPETAGERFCPESLVWNRIARKHQMLFLNKVVKLVEYLPDGLSANITKARVNSLNNTVTFYRELSELDLSLMSRARAAINLLRFAFHQKTTLAHLGVRPLWFLPFVLPAFAFYLRDLKLLKNRATPPEGRGHA